MIVWLTLRIGRKRVWIFCNNISKPYTVLYFLSKDNTSWCTVQQRVYSIALWIFYRYDVQVIWWVKMVTNLIVGLLKNRAWKFRWYLILNGSLHNQFGAVGRIYVWKKGYMWTIRSTFILDTWVRYPSTIKRQSMWWHAQDWLLDYVSTSCLTHIIEYCTIPNPDQKMEEVCVIVAS